MPLTGGIFSDVLTSLKHGFPGRYETDQVKMIWVFSPPAIS
jgi:hypothetical protein